MVLVVVADADAAIVVVADAVAAIVGVGVAVVSCVADCVDVRREYALVVNLVVRVVLLCLLRL